MAKATPRTVKVPKTTFVEQKDGVTLELDREEAATLLLLTRLIDGSEYTSLRCHTKAMAVALYDAGVPYTGGSDLVHSEGRTGIHFAAGSKAALNSLLAR